MRKVTFTDSSTGEEVRGHLLQFTIPSCSEYAAIVELEDGGIEIIKIEAVRFIEPTTTKPDSRDALISAIADELILYSQKGIPEDPRDSAPIISMSIIKGLVDRYAARGDIEK